MHKKWKSSPIATLLFLLVSASILYGCILLVRNVAQNSLLGENAGRRQESALVTPAPTPIVTPAPARVVSAIHTPHAATPTGIGASLIPSPDAVPSPAPATPAPTATLLPLTSAPPFSQTGASLLFLGADEDKRADWIVAMHIGPDGCRILSIPRNTLLDGDACAADAASLQACARQLAHIWPVRYPIAVEADLGGVPAFIDALGGVRIDARTLTGAEVDAYLRNGPSDEMLRIARQQACIRACILRLQEVSMLSLLSMRFTVEPYLKSELTAGQLLTLLNLLRHIDPAGMTFHTLPVDSRLIDGVRYYAPDVALVNVLAAEWMK